MNEVTPHSKILCYVTINHIMSNIFYKSGFNPNNIESIFIIFFVPNNDGIHCLVKQKVVNKGR